MNSQDIALQLASRGDAQAIAALSRDFIECGLGWEYRPERIRELIAARDTVTLVARDGDRVIGFAIMSFGDEYAHLVLMAVRPAGQRLQKTAERGGDGQFHFVDVERFVKRVPPAFHAAADDLDDQSLLLKTG